MMAIATPYGSVCWIPYGTVWREFRSFSQLNKEICNGYEAELDYDRS